MINYREKIAEIIAPHVAGLEMSDILDMIEVPADSKMGDYAFPCFKLAKVLRKAPPLIAASIADAIRDADIFDKVEQVNSYVNMFISRENMAQQVVSQVLADGENYGRSTIGEGKKVIV